MQMQQPGTSGEEDPARQQQMMMRQPQQVQPGAPRINLRGGEMMVMPSIPVGMTIPPGLEYLLPTSAVHVRQKTDVIEMLTSIDTPNKYVIYNDQGQFMYYCMEMQGIGGFFNAQWMRENRGFYMMVADCTGRGAFAINRSTKYWTDSDMVVEAPPGVPVGIIAYNSSICSRGVVTIFDAERRHENRLFPSTQPPFSPILAIPFPSDCDCGGDRGYNVVSGSGTVATIVRKYPGFMKQAFTNCDNFALSFPPDLDVRVKCSLIACAIMIDFVDYEQRNNRNDHYGYGYGGYY